MASPAPFTSTQAFAHALAELLERAPSQLPTDSPLRADWIPSPLGDLLAIANSTHLHLLEFLDRNHLPRQLAQLEKHAQAPIGLGKSPATEQARGELQAFFAQKSPRFQTPLAAYGSPFALQVWSELRHIPLGETCSYSDLARRLKRPTATRAVARAVGANPIALLTPCHRVIGANGALTGYAGGLWRKQKLLEIEQPSS